EKIGAHDPTRMVGHEEGRLGGDVLDAVPARAKLVLVEPAQGWEDLLDEAPVAELEGVGIEGVQAQLPPESLTEAMELEEHGSIWAYSRLGITSNGYSVAS